MPSITLNSKISLRPLTQQVENGVVVLGHANEFLELPEEGVRSISGIPMALKMMF